MCYADTCYVLALILPNDIWYENAENIRKQATEEERKVWACETTFHELLMHAHGKNLDAVRYMRDALAIVHPDNVKEATLLKAAILVRDKKLEPADALIAAHCSDSGLRIITSELSARDAFAEMGLKLINLRSPRATL